MSHFGIGFQAGVFRYEFLAFVCFRRFQQLLATLPLRAERKHMLDVLSPPPQVYDAPSPPGTLLAYRNAARPIFPCAFG